MFMRSKIQKFRDSKKKGFSLVELVVVMAIIGILLMVMAPNYAGFIDEAKGVGVKSDARTLQTMIELVRVEYDLDDTVVISTLPTAGMDVTKTAVSNLEAFVDELEAKAEGWSTVTIGQLPSIIDGTVDPTDTTP